MHPVPRVAAAPLLLALAWPGAVACSLTHDVDGISDPQGAGAGATTSAGAGGGGNGGGAAVSSGAGATGGATQAASSSVGPASSSGSGCVDAPGCGTAGHPCCACAGSIACSDGSVCYGEPVGCAFCGDIGELCCPTAPNCNGLFPVCMDYACKVCCVVCQGKGMGPPSSGVAVNANDNGGDCAAAAVEWCTSTNEHNCKGNAMDDACCSEGTQCVNAKGWDFCQPP
jgi:hypothetical protein